MSERTAEQTRESESDTDRIAGTTDTGAETRSDDATDSSAAGSYFSVKALVVAFVAIGGGMTLGSLIPMIPYTALLGIPLGAFLHGLLDSERRYIETAIAGALLSGLAVVSSLLPQLLAGLNGARLFAIAGSFGLVFALVGHYFGRDLRSGLTKDIE